MEEPNLDLAQAKRLMNALYEPGDVFYVLTYEDKKDGAKRQQRFTHDVDWSAGDFVARSDERGMAVATSLGVFEPPQSGRTAKRTEVQCRGLSGLGIDIDGKNLEALVPGATTAEQVIPEVLRRLGQRGIRPHALVRSGHGLHVYVLIERLTFSSDEERTYAKDTWYRLTQLLGGASDRFDLSSLLRLPGTLNRKKTTVRVEFIEEHTDLVRPRYTLASVAKAVEDQPSLPADKAVGGKKVGSGRKSGGSAAHVDGHPGDGHLADPWDMHVLGIALKLDTKLAEKRVTSMKATRPKKGAADRSRNDFAYACHLLELGMASDLVCAELGQTAKGLEAARSYVDSTFRAAAARTYPTKSVVSTAGWTSLGSSYDALLYGIEEPAKQAQLEVFTLLERGESPPPTKPAPGTVSVVLTRPGHGKTRGLVASLALRPLAGLGRTGICRSMVRELLYDEYVINQSYPDGVRDDLDDDLPHDHKSLWSKLPDKLKQCVDADHFRRTGESRPVWTEEKLKTVVTDPRSFYINSRHPRELDQGLVWFEDENGPVLPSWANSPDDPRLNQPRAVLKFSARRHRCLLALSAKELKDRRTCLNCPAASCRANMTISVGGAKTYWSKAPFGLLTHAAFETHAVVKPSLNEFDAMVFDELPAMVYRCPALLVSPLGMKSGRAVGWDVGPVEKLTKALKTSLKKLEDASDPKTASLRAEARRVLDALARACKKLQAKASDLLHKTLKGDLRQGSVQVDDLAPLLPLEDFEVLVRLSNLASDQDDDDDADALPEAAEVDENVVVLEGLTTLHDYCGNERLKVFMEADFNEEGGSLVVRRPVNGWPELLHRPDGTVRPTVLLDATAGMDPRYLLAGQWTLEEVPEGDYPNTTIVVTSNKYVSRSNILRLGAVEVAAKLVGDVGPYLGKMVDPAYGDRAAGPPRLLVVTAQKHLEPSLRAALEPYLASGKLPPTVKVDHFGGLRGRNEYRDFDAVYLTHGHLYNDAWYRGLELLLSDFGDKFDRQWVPKSKWYQARSKQLQHRSQVADIYQDTMRIGIRSDPMRRAHIFLPTPDAGFIVRLLRLFRGAKLVLPGGEEVASPLPQVLPAARLTEAPERPSAGPEPSFGEPKHS